MKTPDQIKTALECCRGTYCPKECPYYDECKIGSDAVITDFKQYVQMLESQVPRWIPVTERLPEDGENVIVFVRSCADWWTMDIDWCVNGHWVINADDEWHNITHWMPLPSAPKEASE